MFNGVNEFLPDGLSMEELLSPDLSRDQMIDCLEEAFDNFVKVVSDTDLQFRKAAYQGDLEKMEVLYAKEIIDIQGERTGQTALHRAAQQGHASAVEWLVAKGADYSIPDFKGNTPAMLANNAEIKTFLCAQPQAGKAEKMAAIHQHLLQQSRFLTESMGIAPPNYNEANDCLTVFRGKRKMPQN